jgi:hypothetical protein
VLLGVRPFAQQNNSVQLIKMDGKFRYSDVYIGKLSPPPPILASRLPQLFGPPRARLAYSMTYC